MLQSVRWPKPLARLYLTVTRHLMSFRQRNAIQIGSEVYHLTTGRRALVAVIKESYSSDETTKYVLYCKNDRKRIVAEENDVILISSLWNRLSNSLIWWDWYKDQWLEADVDSLSKGQGIQSVDILGKYKAHAEC